MHDDERANNATMGGRGTADGVIAAVEFAQVGLTGIGITIAPRVADVVRA